MENYVKFELSGYEWVVREEIAPVLKEHVIPLVLSGKSSPRLHINQKKFLRDSLIFSSEDPSLEIFIKHHKYNRASERIKTVLLPSRAKAEWAMGERMRRHGLPVAEPLGYGERRNRGLVIGCMSFQRVVSNAIDLGKYINKNCSLNKGAVFSFSSAEEMNSQPEPSNELLSALGGLVRRMHDAGFRHPDFHAGNVLVESECGQPPELCLIDLHAVRRVPVPLPYVTRRDLAKLFHALRNSLDSSQLRRILAGYKPEASEAEIDHLLWGLLGAADSLEKRRIRSRAKRCLKTSGSFVVERSGDKKIYRKRDFALETVLDVLDYHKRSIVSQGTEIVKITAKSALTFIPVAGGTGQKVYVKEFGNRGFIRRLETLFYVHRGKRAWKAGHLLRVLGVPSSKPLALVEERRHGVLHTSYLIMEEIIGADRLNVFLLRRYFQISGRLPRDAILQKRNFIRIGARVLREFHSKNIYHKDLSEKNLLVVMDDARRLSFYCVDLDSIQFPWRFSLRRRIKNLAQLNGLPACITTQDKVRFYKEYFSLEALTPIHKAVIRIICRLSRRRMEHWRHIDERLKKEITSEEQAYENIAYF